jgi:hypothetical protein
MIGPFNQRPADNLVACTANPQCQGIPDGQTKNQLMAPWQRQIEVLTNRTNSRAQAWICPPLPRIHSALPIGFLHLEL